jgi:ring-1,2-phenylacetyl-CoA epoxidase subunit PaaC
MQDASATWLLRLGDDALVLAQRLSEWCGHGPALEEDIALSNIALDLLGQSRAFLTLAGEREGKGRDEDALAYFRTDREFTNLLLLELPNGHFGDTIMRQCLFDQFALLRYETLAAQNVDLEVAAIASKALKEVKYHAAHSAQWVVRLGDDSVSEAVAAMGVGRLNSELQSAWLERIRSIMEQATLRIPDANWMHRGGRQGKHTEHLSYMLAEMQVLQRTYPGAQW